MRFKNGGTVALISLVGTCPWLIIGRPLCMHSYGFITVTVRGGDHDQGVPGGSPLFWTISACSMTFRPLGSCGLFGDVPCRPFHKVLVCQDDKQSLVCRIVPASALIPFRLKPRCWVAFVAFRGAPSGYLPMLPTYMVFNWL